MTAYRQEDDYPRTPGKNGFEKYTEDSRKYHWEPRSQYDYNSKGPAARVIACFSENYTKRSNFGIGPFIYGKNVERFRALIAELEQIELLGKQEKLSLPEQALLVDAVLRDKRYSPISNDGSYAPAKGKVAHLFLHEYGKDIAVAKKFAKWKAAEIQGGSKAEEKINSLNNEDFPSDLTTRHHKAIFYDDRELKKNNRHIDELVTSHLEESKKEEKSSDPRPSQQIADRRAQLLGFENLTDLQAKYKKPSQASSSTSSSSSSTYSSLSSSPVMTSSSSAITSSSSPSSSNPLSAYDLSSVVFSSNTRNPVYNRSQIEGEGQSVTPMGEREGDELGSGVPKSRS